MSGTQNLNAAVPASPMVWMNTGEARIEWRLFFDRLWRRTGNSSGVPSLGGTITGVTAGAGLTGGGTSGTVTLSLATPLTITGALLITGLVNAVNDAAAATAGVAVNQVYRNGSVLQIRVS